MSQISISGTIYDSTKVIAVSGAEIISSSGTRAVSDSFGKYHIIAAEKDSLSFIYNGKTTAKFAVSQVENPGAFDISLHIRIREKYKMLKEVRVFTRSYREDSIENRTRYASIFNYSKGGLSPSFDPTTGAAGLDINQLINMFRFKRNRQLRKMQERLLEQEQERYINYRFNKAAVRRITRLDGTDLEIFMRDYRPDYEFTVNAGTVDFYQYVLNASYHYRQQKLLKPSAIRPVADSIPSH
ncbi:MAG: hypothetical protein RLY16_2647 [Bacteroidota bacterium]